MGETTSIEFTDRGYRQLLMALREANPPAPTEPVEAEPLSQMVSDGEEVYVDRQGLIRWVSVNRVSDVPDAWRPLLVGRSRREESDR